MSSLVNYSDSDDSISDPNDKTSLTLPCPFAVLHSDVVPSGNSQVCGESTSDIVTAEDFFDLKHVADNSNFWTTTGVDRELLPTLKDVENISAGLVQSRSPPSHDESLPVKRNRIEPRTSRAMNSSCNMPKLSVVYQIPSESSQTDQPFEWQIFYPRLSLAWPLLAICVPPDRSGLFGPANLRLHKLSHLDSTSSDLTHVPLPTLVPSNLRGTGSCLSPPVCCVTFHGTPATSDTLHLFTGLVNGSVYVWDMTQGEVVHQVNASSFCGGTLRCVATNSTSSSGISNPQLLIAGCSGLISLWDLRVPNSVRPQQKFCHPGQTYSTSDLLWLTDTQFASTSDTVDRNVCDPNLSVWDTRFGRPISHQLYQERWGCSRLARRPKSGQLGFAVQTHGNAIVEVWGMHKQSQTSSLETGYRLERRWRYEGHDCQAHPLGLSYSSDGAFLASGCWGSTDPVIWHARRTKSHQPGVQFYQRNDAVRFGEFAQMLTDVAWIPHHLISSDYYELIGIRSCGTVVIYRILTDGE